MSALPAVAGATISLISPSWTKQQLKVPSQTIVAINNFPPLRMRLQKSQSEVMELFQPNNSNIDNSYLSEALFCSGKLPAQKRTSVC